MERIKKNGNLEAYSAVNNVYFLGFYESLKDNYSKKQENTTKIESDYFRYKWTKYTCLDKKFIKQINFGFFVILN